jgi:hypothetical protein
MQQQLAAGQETALKRVKALSLLPGVKAFAL